MKLTEKEFIKADGTVIKLTPEWISSKLGEVYELTGDNELRETTLVLNSILQDVILINASEIKNSFLKKVVEDYEMPTVMEGANFTADEPKREVGQAFNEIETL